jgi:alpha-tubulin suppressor-like RCC1 family protein
VGDRCETFKPNPCAPNPCANGGTCTKAGNGYTCACALGWTGPDCEQVDAAACEPNPCLNGGTCSTATGAAACTCPAGFEGDLCQSAIDFCDPDPCLNGGSCVTFGSGFSCVCPAGWSGDTCDVSTACQDAPCANGGACLPVAGGRICACEAGWGGLDCDVASGRLSSFTDHTCGINGAGATLCWGNAANGQLVVPAGVDFAAVAVARLASCGLAAAGGALQCWTSFAAMATPATSDAPVTDLALGDQHGCARDADGAVSCWGTGDDNETKVPAATFAAVAAAASSSCGLKEDGTLLCWGALPVKSFLDMNNDFDPMPECQAACTGTCKLDTVTFFEALCVNDLTPPEGVFGQVAGGVAHFCALDLAGKPTCWGDRTGGKASAPDVTLRYVTAGDRASCGIDAAGAVVCWGDATLVADAPAGTFLALAVGGKHACAIASDGALACWGTSTTGAATPPAGW